MSKENCVLINAAFQAMLKSTKDMVFVKNADLTYIAASSAFVKMVGKECAEEIIGHTDLEIFEDPNLAKRYVGDDKKLFAADEDLEGYIEPITEEEGQARYGSTSKYILRDEAGKQIGILGITKDITKEYRARQRYQQALRYLFELPTDTYAVSYIDVDGWRIITQRKRNIGEVTLQTCYTVEELCQVAVDSIDDKTNEAVAFYSNFTPQRLREIYAQGESGISFEYQRTMPDGSKRWVHNEVRFLIDVDSEHLCVMLSAKDIDAIKQEEQELVVAARMDKMTMLLNRETSMEYIRQVLEEEVKQKHVLFMVDMDNFKQVNDTFGHQAGDEFLAKIAKAMRKCFRDSDIVGRVGGDEFFAFMKNSGGVVAARRKARELITAIRNVCVDYADLDLSGSVGVSMYPSDGETLEELYAKADAALYEAKRKGKNQFVIYETM